MKKHNEIHAAESNLSEAELSYLPKRLPRQRKARKPRRQEYHEDTPDLWDTCPAEYLTER